MNLANEMSLHLSSGMGVDDLLSSSVGDVSEFLEVVLLLLLVPPFGLISLTEAATETAAAASNAFDRIFLASLLKVRTNYGRQKHKFTVTGTELTGP